MRSLHTTTGEQPPLLVTRESLCVGVKTQHRQKQINEQILKKNNNTLTPSSSQHDQPTSIQAMNHQKHLATFTSSKEQNSPKVSERLHQLTLLGHLCSPLPCFSLAAQMSGPALYTTSFWSPWTGETGSDAPPTRPHTPLLLPPLLPTSQTINSSTSHSLLIPIPQHPA